MAPRTYAAMPGELPEGTLCDLFLDAVERFGRASAFRRFTGVGDATEDLSYDQALEIVRAVSGGLAALGLTVGDRAAILSANRWEWALADYGCLLSRVVDVPIYSTLIAPQVAYILKDAGVRLIFASDDEQVVKALAAADEAGLEVQVVAFDEPSTDDLRVLSWSDFLKRGREHLGDEPMETFVARARTVASPSDLATLLYTSGTTGDPKGVMLSHGNLHSNVQASSRVLEVRPSDVTLSFLPLSHVFQRMVDYLLMWSGCCIAYARDIANVAEDLKVVRPTVVVSVPRLYEKVYNKVMDAEGTKAKLLAWATRVAREYTEARIARRSPGLWVAMQYRLANVLVFGKIRAAVGGRLRWFVSGGAPLEPEIAMFFLSVGLPILEGYGLTETSPVTNVNREDMPRIGTVGPPVPGTEIRIAPDGEILVRGPQVMKGYYNNPRATAEVIDPDGWFHTGDIGELTDEGCLRITDRKKDLIVTAGGKNIAPQPIENRLKTNPFVEQVVMVGDKRKFPALLVVPAFSVVQDWAARHGVLEGDREALLQDSRVQAHLWHEIDSHLGDLSRFERPKKLGLLADEFTIEDGTLTPSMKVRRRVVQERFSHLIDRFYDESNHDRTVFTP
jgi:long-chain acyl-CoA synthetase